MFSGVTTSVNTRTPKLAALPVSVAFTVKLYVPDTVGVPLSSPPEGSVSPLGRVPLVTLQVVVTQHAVSCREYGALLTICPRSLLSLMFTFDVGLMLKYCVIFRLLLA